MRIKKITNYLESIAPLYLQESYDNCGLLVGEYDWEVNNALICLDCTEAIVDEAIQLNCNFIIAHHPIIFKGLKKLNGKNYIERTIIKAIKHDIAIYAIHTNLDNVLNGVNGKIADYLQLKNRTILASKENQIQKLVTYCPVAESHHIRTVLWEAGAGQIGDYADCSFSCTGQGTFLPKKTACPSIGNKGELHTEEEKKIEVIYPTHLQNKIIKILKNEHPYEEVAYEIYNLENKHQNIGIGIVGDLNGTVSEKYFLQHLKNTFKCGTIRHTSFLNKPVLRVAVCGGSGSFLLSKAIAAQADVFITADFKYHEFFDAENKILIADIGHYESEQYTKDLINEILIKKFPKFALHLAKTNTNPINYF